MIPLLHDFGDATVLVFGGGSVGARRARTFSQEAHVIVVSPAFVDEGFGGAERVRAAPGPDAVSDWIERVAPALAVAATDDPAVNEAVATAARDRGALVNRADVAGCREAGDVAVPATARDGAVVLAVGTGGASPTLSRHLRDRCAAELDGTGAMAQLLADLREELADWPAARRRAALSEVVASERVWKALGAGAPNAAQLAEDVIDSMGEHE